MTGQRREEVAAKVARMERDLAQYALIPADYPNGQEPGTPDIAVRRLRSWASLMSETHVGLDQQVRACAWSVLRQLDDTRDALADLVDAISNLDVVPVEYEAACRRKYDEALRRAQQVVLLGSTKDVSR